MTLLHGWAFAIGGAGVALPILIHKLTAPRPRIWPLSTLRFVQLAVHDRRSLHRLRNIILLALRTLAVVLLGWVFARPLAGGRVEPQASDGDTIRVILLDVSQSMAAHAASVQAFERARAIAARHLSDQSRLKVILILAGARASAVFDRPSSNAAALTEALSKATVRPERLNLKAALQLVGEMLSVVPAEARQECIVISDFQKGGWAGVDWGGLPVGTAIQLESVGQEAALPNLAILAVQPMTRAQPGKPVSLTIRVGNFTSTDRQVRVEVAISDVTRQIEGNVPARSTAELPCEMMLDEPGWLAGSARLVGVEDALSADDHQSFVVQVWPPTKYALISRENADAVGTSSYYLACGLSPLARRSADSGVVVDRLLPEGVDRSALADAQLIALDHPGKMSRESLNLLASFLRRGRAVMYVTGEPIDATNLAMLEEAAGSGLHLPVTFVPPQSTQIRRDAQITQYLADRAPFSNLGDSLAALIKPLRFGGGLDTRHAEGGLPGEVLASFGDGSAALVVSSCGAGTLAVLNTDLRAGTLPASPAFVPLLAECVEFMTGANRSAGRVVCGEPTTIELPAEVGPAVGLTVVDEADKTADGAAVVDTDSGTVLQWSAMPGIGVYRVHRDGQCVFATASCIPESESDLQGLSVAELAKHAAGGRNVHYQIAGEDAAPRDSAWTWFAVACLICLIVEILALKYFRV